MNGVEVASRRDRLRVVIVHNRYRSANPSGENRVVESEIEQLRSDGVEIVPYIRDSDEIEDFTPVGKVLLGVSPVVNPSVALRFRRLLRDVQPDVVHLHNPFPLISPWIIRTAKAQGVAVVQTVHNYRHVCVNGIHFRDGAPCFDCVGKTIPSPAIRHGCYQGSRARSVPMAVVIATHRQTWRQVDRFLAVGDAVADHLRSIGLDDRRIEVRRNVVEDPGPPEPLGSGVLFVGRLTPEKGITTLVEAWQRSGLGNAGETLSIAGDGELRDQVVHASATDDSIRYLGLLDRPDLDRTYQACALVAIPSQCPEPDPIAAATALAHARPILSSNLGSLPWTVGDSAGWTVPPTAEALARGLAAALADRHELERRAALARARYLLTRDPHHEEPLRSVYERLLTSRSLTEQRPSNP